VEKKVGILGIRDDSNSSFMRGASQAPRIIRETFLSESSNTYCEHGLDIEAITTDFRDISQPDTHELVDEFMRNIMVTNSLQPLTLGGDHAISYPVVRAVSRILNKPLTIVHFDAHPDVYPDFENNPFSHASPFARILETTGVCHKLIALGIRTATPIQRAQYAKYGVSCLEAKDFPAHGRDCATFLQPLIAPTDPVYISFDMDVIEPGLAPGVSHREGGGISVRQAVDAIHAIPGRVVGADLVEFNPLRDISGVTAAVAAKLFKELASKIARSST
jgi:agmatinase